MGRRFVGKEGLIYKKDSDPNVEPCGDLCAGLTQEQDERSTDSVECKGAGRAGEAI